MKNKALNYFLIIAVVSLWGIIVYRVFAANNDDTDLSVSSPIANPVKALADDYAEVKDTTHLQLNYPDPFGNESKQELKQIPINQLVHPTTGVIIQKVPPASKPAINWSFINYAGFIQNASSKKTLAIVTINGREFMMREGESFDQVKLVKNMRDSIKVLFSGKTKFIAMNAK